MTWFLSALLLDLAAVLCFHDGHWRMALFVAICSLSAWGCVWQDWRSP